MCLQLDPHHVWELNDLSSSAYKAVQQVNFFAQPLGAVPEPVPSNMQQRMLSSLIDDGTLSELTQQGNLSFRAHMELLKLDGAGTWLHAIPSNALGTKVEPQLYVPSCSVGSVCLCMKSHSFVHFVMVLWTSGLIMLLHVPVEAIGQSATTLSATSAFA